MALTNSNSKMISIKSRGMVHTSRGLQQSPIRSPYREYKDRIWSIITEDRAEVYEHLRNGTEVRLTVQNYDKDNNVEVVKSTDPVNPTVSNQINEKKQNPEQQPPVIVPNSEKKKKNKHNNQKQQQQQEQPKVEEVKPVVNEEKVEELPVEEQVEVKLDEKELSDEELEKLTAPKSLEVPVDEL